MTLPSQNRISGSKAIEKVKLEGRLYRSRNFGVVVVEKEDADPPKFAFVISKKISKLAVHRNRVNRALNEGVRRNLERAPKGLDFVFLAKKEISSMTTEKIMQEVDKFFSEFKFQ